MRSTLAALVILTLAPAGGGASFLEARYHYGFGEEFEGRAANGPYLPIPLGVEF